MDSEAPHRSPSPVLQAPAGRSDERELVEAVLKRDRKAAAQLVAAHIDAVYAFVRRRLMPRPDLADDVVQDVFLAALSGLSAFTAASPLRQWLLGIARHKVEDLYRQRIRAPGPLDEEDDPGSQPIADEPAPEDTIDAGRLRAKAREVLRQVPERYALLLFWRYWEQRGTREIASTLGSTEKSVERALARARASFKELWMKGEAAHER